MSESIKELRKKIDKLESENLVFYKMKTQLVALRNRLNDVLELWDLHTNKSELANSSIINKFVDQIIKSKEQELK